ncbi:MAG: hypothetical protein Q9M50_10645 [Methylococcales bacterium]|nr:hypothetical protein [Methylococcales bacterium]
MSEVFFILTTVFVAYVVFSVVNDEKKKVQKESPPKEPVPVATSKVDDIKPVTKAATNSPISHSDVESGSIRNPETGDIAKIPNNYRFSKRWIKEVLVKEGLLEKIYKNNELNDDINAKIKQALADLQAIEKYQP